MDGHSGGNLRAVHGGTTHTGTRRCAARCGHEFGSPDALRGQVVSRRARSPSRQCVERSELGFVSIEALQSIPAAAQGFRRGAMAPVAHLEGADQSAGIFLKTYSVGRTYFSIHI